MQFVKHWGWGWSGAYLWLYAVSSVLPTIWKLWQYAGVLQTGTYWYWDGSAWVDSLIVFSEIQQDNLQDLVLAISQVINPLHRINFNNIDQLKVTTDTNSSVLAYNYAYVSPGDADLQYNLPVHSKTPRLIDRQWFIF